MPLMQRKLVLICFDAQGVIKRVGAPDISKVTHTLQLWPSSPWSSLKLHSTYWEVARKQTAVHCVKAVWCITGFISRIYTRFYNRITLLCGGGVWDFVALSPTQWSVEVQRLCRIAGLGEGLCCVLPCWGGHPGGVGQWTPGWGWLTWLQAFCAWAPLLPQAGWSICPGSWAPMGLLLCGAGLWPGSALAQSF